MANIRGFNDLPSDNPRNNYRPVGGAPGGVPGDVQMPKIPFLSGRTGGSGDPRQETFMDMLKLAFCPEIRLFSFSSMICIVNTIFFIISCCIGIDVDGSLLQVDYQSLDDTGAMIPGQIYYDWQIWRIVTSCFLSANFMSIFSNNITILIVGSALQGIYGPKVVGMLYFSSGIIGNIFAATATSHPWGAKAEVATCICGLIATLLAYVILNYEYFGTFGEDLRYNIVCIMIMFVFMITLFFASTYGGGSDQMGYLGGFMAGTCLGAIIPKPIANGAYEQKVKKIMIGILCVYVSLCIILFYTVTF